MAILQQFSPVIGWLINCVLKIFHVIIIRCNNPGNIKHEILHALGFYHEQSRPDRDDYVTIEWTNIGSGSNACIRPRIKLILQDNISLHYGTGFGNFDIHTTTDLGTAYDYGSVMHYDQYAFTYNGEQTIITTVSSAVIRATLSHIAPNIRLKSGPRFPRWNWAARGPFFHRRAGSDGILWLLLKPQLGTPCILLKQDMNTNFDRQHILIGNTSVF